MTKKSNKKKNKKYALAAKTEVPDKSNVGSKGSSIATGSSPVDSVRTPHKSGNDSKNTTTPSRKPTALNVSNSPRDQPRSVIDMCAFPHIISAIISFAPHAALLRLRTSCKHLRDEVDKKLFKHVAAVLSKKGDTRTDKGLAALGPIQHLPIEELRCPQPPFRRLPILYYAPLEIEALKDPELPDIMPCDWRRDVRFQQAAKKSRDRQLKLVTMIDYYDMPHKVIMVNDSQIDSLEIRQRCLQPRILRRAASFHHEIWDLIPNPPHTVVDFVLMESHPMPLEIEVRGAERHVVNILWSKDYADFAFPVFPRIFWGQSVKEVVIVVAEHTGPASVDLPFAPRVEEMSDIEMSDLGPLLSVPSLATVPGMLFSPLIKQLALFGLRGGTIELVGIESLPPTMVYRPQGQEHPDLSSVGIENMSPGQLVEHFEASLVAAMFHGCPEFLAAIDEDIVEGFINPHDLMSNMITFPDRLKFTTLATWLATAADEEKTWPAGQGILNSGPKPERDLGGLCDRCGHQNFAHVLVSPNNSMMGVGLMLAIFGS